MLKKKERKKKPPNTNILGIRFQYMNLENSHSVYRIMEFVEDRMMSHDEISTLENRHNWQGLIYYFFRLMYSYLSQKEKCFDFIMEITHIHAEI